MNDKISICVLGCISEFDSNKLENKKINLNLTNTYNSDGLLIFYKDEKTLEEAKKIAEDEIPHSIFLTKLQGYFRQPIYICGKEQKYSKKLECSYRHNYCYFEKIDNINYIIEHIIYEKNENEYKDNIRNYSDVKISNYNDESESIIKVKKLIKTNSSGNNFKLVKTNYFKILPTDINKKIGNFLDLDSKIQFNKILDKDDRLYKKINSEEFNEKVIIERLKELIESTNKYNTIFSIIELLKFLLYMRSDFIIKYPQFKLALLSKIRQYDDFVFTKELKTLIKNIIEKYS